MALSPESIAWHSNAPQWTWFSLVEHMVSVLSVAEEAWKLGMRATTSADAEGVLACGCRVLSLALSSRFGILQRAYLKNPNLRRVWLENTPFWLHKVGAICN